MNSFSNLVELFDGRCQQSASKPLYCFSNTGLEKDNQIYTYSELEKKIKAIAALLQQYTVPGDRVLLIFAPSIDYILAFWACLYAGVLAVPAYPPINKNTIDKLQSIVENSKPKIILSNKTVIQNIKRLSALKIMSQNGLLKKLIKQFIHNVEDFFQWDFKSFQWIDISKAEKIPQSVWQPHHPKGDDIAFLQYTSGSTAAPKGVMVTHKNLLSNLELVLRTIGKNEEDRMVSWLPPYHDMGLIGNLLFPVYCQFPIMLMSPISFLRNPYLWLKALSDFKGTISGGPNFSYELCVKKIAENELTDREFSLDHWRVVYNGAEPINHQTLENFSEKFLPYGFKKSSYYPLYGLAEATVYVSGNKTKAEESSILWVDRQKFQENKIIISDNRDESSQALVSCGQPMIPLIIVSEYPHHQCLEGEIGEIWLSGECVTKGYWEKVEETQLAFNGTLESNPEGCYLKTGDLGFILNGNLYVTGRIKDLIIINGRNYYPQDIEAVVEKSHSLIRSGCTVALSVKDSQEQLAIVAEVKQESSEIYETISKEIYANINLNFSLTPKIIALISPKTLPKTTSGKVRRKYTGELLQAQQLELLYQWMPLG